MVVLKRDKKKNCDEPMENGTQISRMNRKMHGSG